ncbi:hypothetical protein ACWCOP_07545 [Maricaulaceae bacterium MS644]
MLDWLTNAGSALISIVRDVVVPLGWQVTVVVLVLMFRNQIAGAIERLKKFGRDGAELEPIQSRSAERGPVQETLGTRPPGPETPLNHDSDKTLAPFFEQFKTELAQMNLTNETEALIDQVVTERRRAYSETILRHIYGSQITLLDELLVTGVTNSDMIRRHFNAHLAKSEHKLFNNPEDWIHYLVQSGIVVGAYPEYRLTDAGRAALSYFRLLSIDARQFPF